MQISEYYGVPVSDFDVASLNNIKVDDHILTKLTENNVHLVTFALQKQHNLPSESTMRKTGSRNNDNDKTHRYQRYNPFKFIFKKPAPPKVQKVLKKKPFQICSPEQIVIKAARQKCASQLLKAKSEIKELQGKIIPKYFANKKANQKRRRHERTLIMKIFREQLSYVFGSIIFRNGWRMGRSQMKVGLELPESQFSIQKLDKEMMQRRQRGQIWRAKHNQYLRQKYQRKAKRRAERRIDYQYNKQFFDNQKKFKELLFQKDFDIYDLKMAYRQAEKKRKEKTDKFKKKKKRNMIKDNIWAKDHSKRTTKFVKEVEQNTQKIELMANNIQQV